MKIRSTKEYREALREDGRSITVKTMCSGSSAVTIATAGLVPGNNTDKSVQVRRINNIPDDVTDETVVVLFERTVDITWLGGRHGRLVFDFSELGEGKIIRE